MDGYRPPAWPGQERPQQFHLDFDVDDLEAEEERALALGATVLERTDRIRPGANWRVYAIRPAIRSASACTEGPGGYCFAAGRPVG